MTVNEDDDADDKAGVGIICWYEIYAKCPLKLFGVT
jgi:hypothetical protein